MTVVFRKKKPTNYGKEFSEYLTNLNLGVETSLLDNVSIEQINELPTYHFMGEPVPSDCIKTNITYSFITTENPHAVLERIEKTQIIKNINIKPLLGSSSYKFNLETELKKDRDIVYEHKF